MTKNLNALGSFQSGASLANQIIQSRLNQGIANERLLLQRRQQQQQQAFQQIARNAFEQPDIVLPQLYARDPQQAARISDGIQQQYDSQYKTLKLLTDTPFRNKQATYDILKPQLKRQFPELQFGDTYSKELNDSLKTQANVIKAKRRTALQFRDTAQGVVGFDPASGEVTPTGIGPKEDYVIERTDQGLARINKATGEVDFLTDQQGEGLTTAPSGAKPPAGYRFTESGDLEAIPGGPATKQSAEAAGKVALIKQGEKDIGRFRNLIMDEDGDFDRLKLAALVDIPLIPGIDKGTLGAREEYSTLFNAINARLRLESGAAVPESEVERALRAFLPNPFDSQKTIKSKIDRMEEFFTSAKKEIGQGRGATPLSQQNKQGDKDVISYKDYFK